MVWGLSGEPNPHRGTASNGSGDETPQSAFDHSTALKEAGGEVNGASFAANSDAFIKRVWSPAVLERIAPVVGEWGLGGMDVGWGM
mmetsp:Transcript_27630/g.28039  ORF Transcript_27630/g.28039 Transcript_27630/m.28039 type:complete len:86 (+) Transcript_27630:541-798(+)|eukprot:CAMPEP_0171308414 /NCGR_PEP_ID=MMETSP0816-20121228/18577_1 /TAXON_ID=420281 /ORGANISM="Proboscia inermis, Strain CCAP1064/1" /LENGTH=85 /DNA_ID=CAMNT_0011791323 /DNA_START=365 /DNA_END=622 /DNA_ORIENTATION=+